MGTYCKYHLAQGVLSALADSDQVLIAHPDKSNKCSVEGCNRRVYFQTLFYQRGSGIVFYPSNQTKGVYTGTWYWEPLFMGTALSGAGSTIQHGTWNYYLDP